jgi:hypothetical protein
MTQRAYTSGLLFSNVLKRTDRDPDRMGRGELDCPRCGERTAYWLSAWDTLGKHGNSFWSLSFEPKEAAMASTLVRAVGVAHPEETTSWTLTKVEKLANGQLYWYAGRDHSRQRIRKLRPAERAAFEQAKLDGYLVCTSYSAEAELQHARYRYCCALRQPYLLVRKKRRYGYFDLDLMPTDGTHANPPQISAESEPSPEATDEIGEAWCEVVDRLLHVTWTGKHGLSIEQLDSLAQTILTKLTSLAATRSVAVPARAGICQQDNLIGGSNLQWLN